MDDRGIASSTPSTVVVRHDIAGHRYGDIRVLDDAFTRTTAAPARRCEKCNIRAK